MRIAFGKVVITPPDGPENKPMAGYSRPHYAHGKLDDVYARAVLLEDKFNKNLSHKLLLISLDFLKIPMVIADYIKEKIQEKADFGLGPGRILIHAIHTHSAPDLTGEFYWPGGVFNVIKGILFGANRNDKYIVWMTNQIVKMVKEMVKNLKEGEIAFTKKLINKDILINRRHPKRRTKQDLYVTVARDKQTKEIIGLITSFGMHPTTLSWKNDKMSADYPGRVCAKIEELYEYKATAVFFTAPAGDLNPITTCGTDFDKLEDDPKARNTVYEQYGTYKHTKKIGYYLGEQAVQLANSVKDEEYFDKLEFKAYVKRFWIPFEDYQPYVYNWGNWLANKAIVFVKKWFLFPIALMHPENQEPNFPGLAIKAYPFSFRKGYKINVYTVIQYIDISLSKSSDPKKIKKLNILGVPGELFEDIEKRLKERSPVGKENTWVIQNANDWCAYLFPIKEYITQGGYEPFASTTPIAGHRVEYEFYLFWKEIEKGVQLGYW